MMILQSTTADFTSSASGRRLHHFFLCNLTYSFPRPCRTGWWTNAPALMTVWSQRPIDDYLAAGGRPMLVLYGAQDGITRVPNVLSLQDELGDQERLVEIAGERDAWSDPR
jgi:hypothetical protein